MSYRGGSRSNSCRIYIGNLPEDVREKELEDLFYKFGRIRDIDIKYGRTTNGTAYAFVEFEDVRDAEEAVESRDGHKFFGTRLRVEFTGERRPKRAMGRSSGPPRRSEYRVYVSGLPSSASWQDLKDHMRQAGPVGYANIENGEGVVEYENYDDMKWALAELDKSEFKNIFTKTPITVRADRAASRGRYSRSRSHSSRGRRRYRSRSHSHRSGRYRSTSGNRDRRGEGKPRYSRGRSVSRERDRWANENRGGSRRRSVEDERKRSSKEISRSSSRVSGSEVRSRSPRYLSRSISGAVLRPVDRRSGSSYRSQSQDGDADRSPRVSNENQKESPRGSNHKSSRGSSKNGSENW